MSGEVFTRGANGQGGVQHTFLLSQVVGQLLDLCRRSANEDHLSAQVVVEVHDSGSGMPADVQAQIFRPLFTTKGPRGTGLPVQLRRPRG